MEGSKMTRKRGQSDDREAANTQGEPARGSERPRCRVKTVTGTP